MSRKRVIDTDELYFDTEIVSLLGLKGLHLYIRLWGLAEDWGGYKPDYAGIALRMGALKFTSKEVEGCIRKLVSAGKIITYTVQGMEFHWIKNLMKHQPLKNPSLPCFPLPEWGSCEVKKYKSGKKYAKYTVITGSLPVLYW